MRRQPEHGPDVLHSRARIQVLLVTIERSLSECLHMQHTGP